MTFRFSQLWLCAVVSLALVGSVARAGTKVEVATTVGTFVLELYDDEKPITVANFLRYIETGRYTNSLINRLMPGFVVQGGGFVLHTTETSNSVDPIEPFAPIRNEYATGARYSNVYGTIAMAKVPAEDDSGNPIPGGGPDSATCAWFINLADNSENLDSQNGGFTVFGKVVSGLDVLAAFNSTFDEGPTGGRGVYDASSDLGGSFTDMPLLRGQLVVDALIFTRFTVLPPDSAFSVASRKKLVTKRAAVVLRGTSKGAVSRIEWRVGRKGKFRKKAVAGDWKIRVGRLSAGRNLIFVRGKTAEGQIVGSQKIRVIRK